MNFNIYIHFFTESSLNPEKQWLNVILNREKYSKEERSFQEHEDKKAPNAISFPRQEISLEVDTCSTKDNLH